LSALRLKDKAWTMPEKTETASRVERAEQENDKAGEMLSGGKFIGVEKCPNSKKKQVAFET